MDLIRMPIAQREEILKQVRDTYKEGTVIELVEMNDPYSKIPVGTEGVVSFVDDAGTIHVKWKNGSSLGVVYGVDRVRIKNTPI